ncbi:MAG: peptidylprolyl isomerase [Alphaproteobacteria bacterium]
MLKTLALAAGLAISALVAAPAVHAEDTDTQAAAMQQNMLKLQLPTGIVTIQMRPDLAPKHVERITTLANQGFYDGIIFHRVIDGFMAQAGDPTGTGTSGSDLPNLEAEFTDEPYLKGTVGMARTQDRNGANSQWFICFTDTSCSFLKGQYTVWGRVVSGMEHVNRIKKVQPGGFGTKPRGATPIIQMRTADQFTATPTGAE